MESPDDSKYYLYLYKNLHSPGNSAEVFNDIQREISKGKLHILYNEYQMKYGYNSNFIIPYNNNNLVILNNPNDVEKIVREHIKKTPYLKPLLYDSIISTTSVEHWKDQRKDYQPAFSSENYQHMINISNARSRHCVSILKQKLLDNSEIDIYNFLLNETLAQLYLAMFGFSNEFQKETNPKIRETFRGENIPYGKEYAFSLLDEIKRGHGSLSVAMATRDSKLKTKREDFGNALTFTFAGHDTTANTLTWLIFELCRNSKHYTRLQAEVMTFWKNKGNNLDIAYDDFKQLPFMTRCIMETLRLWTSIPNGTSRELEHDDYITGINGAQILVKKGTYIQIPNWTRHRNPLLWGSDCNVFNPDRDFKDDEIWNNSGIAAYNPSSERFSPFTYGPRDCIGKNFSQLEMRIILLHLLSNFTFSLKEEQINKYSENDLSFNAATLGPRSIHNKDLFENSLAMYINITPRVLSKL